MGWLSDFKAKTDSDYEEGTPEETSEETSEDVKEEEESLDEHLVDEPAPTNVVELPPRDESDFENRTQLESENQRLRDMISEMRGELNSLKETIRQPVEPEPPKVDPFQEDRFDDTIGDPQALRSAIQQVVRDEISKHLTQLRSEIPQVARQETQAMSEEERARREFTTKYPALADKLDYVSFVVQQLDASRYGSEAAFHQAIAEKAAKGLGIELNSPEKPASSVKPAIPTVQNSSTRPGTRTPDKLFDPEAATFFAKRR